MLSDGTNTYLYGNVMSHSGEATSVFGFTGEAYDAATGLEYLRARYYSSAQGRFTTRDVWPGDPNAPMSYNAWNYTNGNPVNFADPTGHSIYSCDYSKSPPKCIRIYIYRGPTYSYTGLIYQYFGLKPQGGAFAGLPEQSWVEAHIHEWNGEWGETEYGDPYRPSASEIVMMRMAEAHRLGCDTLDLRRWVFVQVLGTVPAPPFSNDEGPLEGPFVEGVGHSNPIKNVYQGKRYAPNWPKDFRPESGGLKKYTIKDKDLLAELRKVERGDWKKVMEDGYLSDGTRVSVHYNQSPSGKVFDLEVKPGWSNR